MFDVSYFHVRLEIKGESFLRSLAYVDLNELELRQQILDPRAENRALVRNGRTVSWESVDKILIATSDKTAEELAEARQERRRRQSAGEGLAIIDATPTSLGAASAGQDVTSTFIVGPPGWRMGSHGPPRTPATEQALAQLSQHARLTAARRAFDDGDYESAVFKAMRAVENAVKEQSAIVERLQPQALMAKAFKADEGPLADHASDPAEQQGTMYLFMGAVAALRNPVGHREGLHDDPSEAAAIVVYADLLLRIVDRASEAAGPGLGADKEPSSAGSTASHPTDTQACITTEGSAISSGSLGRAVR